MRVQELERRIARIAEGQATITNARKLLDRIQKLNAGATADILVLGAILDELEKREGA